MCMCMCIYVYMLYMCINVNVYIYIYILNLCIYVYICIFRSVTLTITRLDALFVEMTSVSPLSLSRLSICRWIASSRVKRLLPCFALSFQRNRRSGVVISLINGTPFGIDLRLKRTPSMKSSRQCRRSPGPNQAFVAGGLEKCLEIGQETYHARS